MQNRIARCVPHVMRVTELAFGISLQADGTQNFWLVFYKLFAARACASCHNGAACSGDSADIQPVKIPRRPTPKADITPVGLGLPG